MSSSIKIPKDHLKNHPELSAKLSLLCSRVKEEFDACVYTPEPGVLMTFLRLLAEHKVGYELVSGDRSNISHPNSNGGNTSS